MDIMISESTEEEQEYIDDTLTEFNLKQVAATQEQLWVPLSYCIKDNGAIIAGINAEMYCWNIVFVDVLYVDGAYRKKGLGSLLLARVEAEAKSKGVHLVHLDTFDFQARDFYKKHGYEVFGVLDDCPKGHVRYYMKKILV